MANYRNRGQQRILDVMVRLSGHEIEGLALKDVSDAARISPSNAKKDLENLKLAGIAEQIPETGRWRLGPKLVQIALAHLRNLERAHTKWKEIQQRYDREPK